MQRKTPYRYRRHGSKNGRVPALLLKKGAGVLAVVLLSLFFVFCHDVITQCRYFALREISVTGADRIGVERILREAALHPGMNALSVNLAVTRKRLLANPWISEAAIRRVIPSGLQISIREHQPVAILDLGRRFLIDDNGMIFKEIDPSDPQELPTIHGLSYSDLDLDSAPRPTALRSTEAIAATAFAKSPAHSSIYKAAVSALLLVHRHASVLPNEQLGSIRVDREIGVTIHTVDRKQSIQMGFNDYARKLDVLESVLAFIRDTDTWRLGEIESIDLKNPDRVVVNLLRKKEV